MRVSQSLGIEFWFGTCPIFTVGSRWGAAPPSERAPSDLTKSISAAMIRVVPSPLLALVVAVVIVSAALASPLLAARLERRRQARAAELVPTVYSLDGRLDRDGLERSELYDALADRLRIGCGSRRPVRAGREARALEKPGR